MNASELCIPKRCLQAALNVCPNLMARLNGRGDTGPPLLVSTHLISLSRSSQALLFHLVHKGLNRRIKG